MIVSYFVFVYT